MKNLLLKVMARLLFLAIVAAAAGWSAVKVYNGQPAVWLCDYDERPGKKHKTPRLEEKRAAGCFSVGFFFSLLLLWLQFGGQWHWLAFGLVILWLSLQIALADWQFLIIPDQWIGALALVGLVFYTLNWRLFHASRFSLLGGLLAGLILLLINGLGRLLTKADVVGFGDVKLVFAMGVLCGPFTTLQILFAAFFVSGFFFGLLLLLGRLANTAEKPLGPFLVGVLACHLLFYEQCQGISQWLLAF